MSKRRQNKSPRAIYHLIRDAMYACIESDFLSHGAALAYYTGFAIAPLKYRLPQILKTILGLRSKLSPLPMVLTTSAILNGPTTPPVFIALVFRDTRRIYAGIQFRLLASIFVLKNFLSKHYGLASAIASSFGKRSLPSRPNSARTFGRLSG